MPYNNTTYSITCLVVVDAVPIVPKALVYMHVHWDSTETYYKIPYFLFCLFSLIK
jgi:hypothetical protein